ncbi:hypothetical protein Tco_0980330 [Tanacetum coccineum]
MTTVNRRQVENFVWEHIIFIFGVPQTVTSKDDKQSAERIFPDFCKGLKLYQSFSPITEHMEIMNYIEKQLIRSQQGWANDLPQILWEDTHALLKELEMESLAEVELRPLRELRNE